MKDIRELKDFIKLTGLNNGEFAKRVGVSDNYLSMLIHGKRPISEKFIIKIEDAFRDIDFKNTLKNKELRYFNNLKPVSTTNEPTIPYYDIDVSAGSIEMFEKRENVVERIMVGGFEDCTFAVSVYGESMYPNYASGNIVVCKEIKDKSLILYGESYLIVTEDYRMIKRVAKGDTESSIVLVSDNQELTKAGYLKYQAFTIPKDKIRKLYLVKGKIERNTL